MTPPKWGIQLRDKPLDMGTMTLATHRMQFAVQSRVLCDALETIVKYGLNPIWVKMDGKPGNDKLDFYLQ